MYRRIPVASDGTDTAARAVDGGVDVARGSVPNTVSHHPACSLLVVRTT